LTAVLLKQRIVLTPPHLQAIHVSSEEGDEVCGVGLPGLAIDMVAVALAPLTGQITYDIAVDGTDTGRHDVRHVLAAHRGDVGAVPVLPLRGWRAGQGIRGDHSVVGATVLVGLVDAGPCPAPRRPVRQDHDTDRRNHVRGLESTYVARRTALQPFSLADFKMWPVRPLSHSVSGEMPTRFQIACSLSCRPPLYPPRPPSVVGKNESTGSSRHITLP
jgi:hypothetical protein